MQPPVIPSSKPVPPCTVVNLLPSTTSRTKNNEDSMSVKLIAHSEISLKPTPHFATSPEEIWPESNEIDIAFEIFQLAKQERNFNNADVSSPYIKYSSGGKITVVGNPNLSQVKTIMIGVRNPKKTSFNTEDDGLPKCGQIWVNELRLTDFDEYGGWAANGRLTARVADVGNVVILENFLLLEQIP